mmetsp:Transcript_7978/g.19032  ORF Transcript_7978/g.19032 Transcript_7978/m.19032 type:complete len:90 (+) Transcript_7978:326-595(+)
MRGRDTRLAKGGKVARHAHARPPVAVGTDGLHRRRPQRATPAKLGGERGLDDDFRPGRTRKEHEQGACGCLQYGEKKNRIEWRGEGEER